VKPETVACAQFWSAIVQTIALVLLVIVTYLYVRYTKGLVDETRATRLYERNRADIREVYTPLIRIVDENILAPLLIHAERIAPSLRHTKELDFWRIPDETLKEYGEIHDGTEKLKRLNLDTRADLIETFVECVRDAGVDSGRLPVARQVAGVVSAQLLQRKIPVDDELTQIIAGKDNIFASIHPKDYHLAFREACNCALQRSGKLPQYDGERSQLLEAVRRLQKDLYETRYKKGADIGLELARSPPPEDQLIPL